MHNKKVRLLASSQINTRLYICALAGLVLIFGGCVFGWSSNIYKLATGACGKEINTCVVVRAIGIPVVPVGSVVGYFDF